MNMKTKMKKTAGRMSFFKLLESRIRHFKDLGKEKTASNYSCAMKHFTRFRNGEDIEIEDLTVNLMKDFQAYLVEKGLKMNTISLYNRMLKAAYNYALDEEILQTDKRPFRKVFTGREKTRKRTLDRKALKKLVRTDLSVDRGLEFARDMFLFSIYMQGMAFVDIARLTKSQVRSGHVVYQRSKTNHHLRIAIQPCAKEIMEKWMVKDPECPYLFPILYNLDKKKEVRYDTALRTHNKRLNKIAGALELGDSLSSYVSRHTWASLAKWSGIRDTIICEAMGHNNIETTSIYLASLSTEVIASANKKVLSELMKWRM